MAFAEITQDGLARKSLQEIRQELQNAWRQTFGTDLDLSAGSPDGHHVDLEANMLSSLVELAQGLYASMNPGSATGIWLDIILDYVGLERIGAAQSKIDLVISGDVGVAIPAGTIMRPPAGAANFATTTAITLNGAGGTSVRAVSTSVGPIPAPAGIWKMVSIIPGVAEIRAEISGIEGRNQETDDEFRQRGEVFARGGRATEDAIVSYMLNTVPGISSVSVISNRDDVVDAEGRPPHCIEVVVEGGEDADVAAGIFQCVAAGIKTFGNYPGPNPEDGWPVVDSSGRTQRIQWTRGEDIFAWFWIVVKEYEEEALPDDYEAQIKAAIITWAETQYTLGKDVIPGRVAVPVWAVPGILSVDVLVAVESVQSVEPADNDYSRQRISVDARHIVRIAESRIYVEIEDAG